MNQYTSGLNERQREAVMALDGPLLVLAGAGSGKTKMLTARMAAISAARGTSDILAITFTNKAAKEMRERVAVFGSQVKIGTFHAICLQMLRVHGSYIGLKPGFVIYDDQDQAQLLGDIVKKLNLAVEDPKLAVKAFAGMINRAKCQAQGPDAQLEDDADYVSRYGRAVYTLYEQGLMERNAIDFGGIICQTVFLLAHHLDVRAYYQRKFRYIHVDEYQDTNKAQYLFLMYLAAKRFGGHENCCVVGDEDQSIYAWRGADIRNILDFEKDFPHAKVIKLEQNYRSTAMILGAASDVIAHNRERKAKRLFTDQVGGEPVRIVKCQDERMEARTVLDAIVQKQRAGRSLRECSIFYRTNAQSRQFEDACMARQIPYEVIGALRFYDRKEIRDVLAYWRVLVNPADSVSLKRIINVPARGIGQASVAKCEAQGGMLYEACQNSENAKIRAFVGMVESLRVQEGSLAQLYDKLLDATGMVRKLESEKNDESRGRVENLAEFRSVLVEFESDVPASIQDFLEQSMLHGIVEEGPKHDAVQLMTLHSSKGLEFPFVFMTGMEEGLFPSKRALDDGMIEEERRLCYVGMTRARECLMMTSSRERMLWGRRHFSDVSQFCCEIPSKWREQKSEVEVSQVTQSALIGSIVQHPSFGRGVIKRSEGSGAEQKVSVLFGVSEKKFYYRFIQSYVSI